MYLEKLENPKFSALGTFSLIVIIFWVYPLKPMSIGFEYHLVKKGRNLNLLFFKKKIKLNFFRDIIYLYHYINSWRISTPWNYIILLNCLCFSRSLFFFFLIQNMPMIEFKPNSSTGWFVLVSYHVLTNMCKFWHYLNMCKFCHHPNTTRLTIG